MKRNLMILRNIILFVLFFVSGCMSLGGGEMSNPKPSKELRENYIASHQGLSSTARGLILNGLVDVGMSKDEVRVSWGELDKVTIPSKKEDFDEIWVYAPSWKFKTYLYFKNDIVIRTGD